MVNKYYYTNCMYFERCIIDLLTKYFGQIILLYLDILYSGSLFDESVLYHDLLDGYVKVRPAEKWNTTVQLHIAFFLYKIESLVCKFCFTMIDGLFLDPHLSPNNDNQCK